MFWVEAIDRAFWPSLGPVEVLFNVLSRSKLVNSDGVVMLFFLRSLLRRFNSFLADMLSNVVSSWSTFLSNDVPLIFEV